MLASIAVKREANRKATCTEQFLSAGDSCGCGRRLPHELVPSDRNSHWRACGARHGDYLTAPVVKAITTGLSHTPRRNTTCTSPAVSCSASSTKHRCRRITVAVFDSRRNPPQLTVRSPPSALDDTITTHDAQHRPSFLASSSRSSRTLSDRLLPKNQLLSRETAAFIAIDLL
ncbi:hypothetical protein EJ03DRAFT_331621 [Teratosphaeria nubilosa]|uniref:Uncharacterized protein n=1 Tax=Teratosphaeria nubilosa TaxID=161662 RepID=A0A6G1KVL7_9PEZI|nr:hypothetical protein EJ03DRAFT_331621 [Teratosphaeria nubilosa]